MYFRRDFLHDNSPNPSPSPSPADDENESIAYPQPSGDILRWLGLVECWLIHTRYTFTSNMRCLIPACHAMVLKALDKTVAVSGRRSVCEGHVDMTMIAERKAVVQRTTPPAHMVIMGSRRCWVGASRSCRVRRKSQRLSGHAHSFFAIPNDGTFTLLLVLGYFSRCDLLPNYDWELTCLMMSSS
jgi:hypothetical protein